MALLGLAAVASVALVPLACPRATDDALALRSRSGALPSPALIARTDPYTLALVRVRGASYDMLGSGVLLQVAEHRFLITARHVLQKLNGSPLGTSNLRDKQTVVEAVTIYEPDGPWREDGVDISAILLTTSTAADIARSGNSFLSLSDLSIDERARPDDLYLTNGYPEAASKGRERLVRQRTLGSAMDLSALPIYDARRHLGIHYPVGQAGLDGREIAPSPGMSGGGLWRSRAGESGLPLVAIVSIGPDPMQGGQHEDGLVGTKVRYVLYVIGKNEECRQAITAALPDFTWPK